MLRFGVVGLGRAATATVPAIARNRNTGLVAAADYIATPTHLHTQHVLTAVGCGKHVIVEKPLAISLEDADRMIAAVEAAGVQLIVGHSQSHEPPIRAMRQLVRSGELGE